ncbi:MAG TPA: sugar phosphate isomerase/epimerase [Verrucomicrobiae bacterium]|jgi:sugar phosphate isomerase/epimerase|nr:sugar phosphate isomerase/epimerase [Verrucomicrobiae bacterium]
MSIQFSNNRLWRRFSLVTAVACVAAVGVFSGCMTGSHSGKGKLGLQLYSLRAQLGASMSALDEVRNWGIKYVELAGTYKKTPEQFKAELDKRGLVAVSGHFSFEEWSRDPETVLAQAEKLGLKYVGVAWIPHGDKFDEATCRKAAKVFNHAGELAARHHMVFFYHTHGYEFVPFENGTLFDLLLKETDPNLVKLEMDIFWIAHAGQDPVKLLEAHPDRFELMHVKDMRKSTETGLATGHSDVRNDVAMGEGKLPLPEILEAGKRIGIKYYFIEDESPSSEQQIPQSVAYLEKYLQK